MAGPLLLDDIYLENTDEINLTYPGEATAVPSDGAEFAAGARLGTPYPNPFNPAIKIPFEMSRAGQAEIAIHDGAGRLVRRLIAATQREGSHEANWDGCDDMGRRMASGVYSARLTVDGRSAGAVRVVMLK